MNFRLSQHAFTFCCSQLFFIITYKIIIVKINLKSDPRQTKRLLETIEVELDFCCCLARKNFRQYDLHDLVYYSACEIFDIAAPFAIHCIAKVADSYKKDKRIRWFFKPHGAVTFDNRILSYRLGRRMVTIWTVAQRQEIPLTCGTKGDF